MEQVTIHRSSEGNCPFTLKECNAAFLLFKTTRDASLNAIRSLLLKLYVLYSIKTCMTITTRQKYVLKQGRCNTCSNSLTEY